MLSVECRALKVLRQGLQPGKSGIVRRLVRIGEGAGGVHGGGVREKEQLTETFFAA